MAGKVYRLTLSAVFIAWLFHSSMPVEVSMFDRFLRFIDNFERQYRNNTEEFEHRFANFKTNLERIAKLNGPYSQQSAVFGLNKFSDLSQDEFTAQYLDDLRPVKLKDTTLKFHSQKSSGWKQAPSTPTALPKKVDWRDAGVVSPIKNQGHCGACWAFATTEVVESGFAIAHNSSAPLLAVQQLIDCSYKNYGCKGGDICVALNYVKSAGITYNKNYPLTDSDDPCHPLSPTDQLVRIDTYTCHRYVNKEDQILQLLATVGPVSAAVDASTWNNYVGGIIRFHCDAKINHAISIVGYDLTGPVPYYIVRNSWGTDFGMDGYMYIEVGSNLCGIAEEVSDVHMS